MKAPIKLDRLEIETKPYLCGSLTTKWKTDPDKCHSLISSTSQSELKVGNVKVKSSTYEKLYGTTIDNKLSLSALVKDLCKKVSRKIHALARVTPFMTVSKGRIFVNAFLDHSSVTVH